MAVIVGQASTGKTFALDAARTTWHPPDCSARRCPRFAARRRGLQSGSGIPSPTIHPCSRTSTRARPAVPNRRPGSRLRPEWWALASSTRLIDRHSQGRRRSSMLGDRSSSPRSKPVACSYSLIRPRTPELTEIGDSPTGQQATPPLCLARRPHRSGLAAHGQVGLTIGETPITRSWPDGPGTGTSATTGRDAVMLALHPQRRRRRPRLHLIANDRLGPSSLNSEDPRAAH